MPDQRRFIIRAFLFALPCVLLTVNTHAFKSGTVRSDGTLLKESPSATAKTKAILSAGTKVNASDWLTGGYYRVSTKTASGWVFGDNLWFADRKLAQRREWMVQALGGLGFWSTNAINAVIGSTALNGGAAVGGGVGRDISRTLLMAIRVERMFKSASGSSADGTALAFALSSTPVMLGVEWTPVRRNRFSLSLLAYGGAGVATSVSASASSFPPPNVTTFSAIAPAALFGAGARYTMFGGFSLFAQGGYRYLKASGVSPQTPAGAGGGIFSPTSQTAGIQPLEINLSGPVAEVGIRFNADFSDSSSSN